jgi:predicted RNase H-like HicB family nuclease
MKNEVNDMSYKVGVIIENDQYGYYAYCPELEGCQTQGDTFEEVRQISKKLSVYILKHYQMSNESCI